MTAMPATPTQPPQDAKASTTAGPAPAARPPPAGRTTPLESRSTRRIPTSLAKTGCRGSPGPCHRTGATLGRDRDFPEAWGRVPQAISVPWIRASPRRAALIVCCEVCSFRCRATEPERAAGHGAGGTAYRPGMPPLQARASWCLSTRISACIAVCSRRSTWMARSKVWVAACQLSRSCRKAGWAWVSWVAAAARRCGSA